MTISKKYGTALKTYVKSMKLYWQYRLEKQREANSRTE